MARAGERSGVLELRTSSEVYLRAKTCVAVWPMRGPGQRRLDTSLQRFEDGVGALGPLEMESGPASCSGRRCVVSGRKGGLLFLAS